MNDGSLEGKQANSDQNKRVQTFKEMEGGEKSNYHPNFLKKEPLMNDGSLEGKQANSHQNERVNTFNEEHQEWSTQIKRPKIGDGYGQHVEEVVPGKAVDGGGKVGLGDDSSDNGSVKRDTLGKKADIVQSLDAAAHMDGTNSVTGIIVDLWREYKEMQTQVEEKGRSDLTTDEIQNKLEHFSKDQLDAADERGYNALLKACSLPGMSPHVMQYLITTRKVDLNCQLPSDFDVNHSEAKELVPGMSSLSVAIRKKKCKISLHVYEFKIQDSSKKF